jgi:hypothetical protein
VTAHSLKAIGITGMKLGKRLCLSPARTERWDAATT